MRSSDGVEVGRGLVNFSSAECTALLGRGSASFQSVLGYEAPEALVHRRNIALLAQA